MRKVLVALPENVADLLNKEAKNEPKRELAEVDLLDTMLSSLVELLEKKGVLSQKE